MPPFTPDAILGRTAADFLDADAARPLRAAEARVLATGVGERVDLEVDAGGGRLELEVALEPRRADDGRVLGLAGYARDVRDRRRGERERATSTRTSSGVSAGTRELADQRVLRSLLASMAEGVVIVDARRRYVMANPAVVRVAGVDPTTLPLEGRAASACSCPTG